jgi:hypothetical protein
MATLESRISPTRGERFAMAVDNGVKITAEVGIECYVRAALLRESKRLGQQTDGRRGRTNDRHSFGVTLDNDFAAGAHACQQCWKVVRRFGLRHAKRTLVHRSQL